MDEIDWMKEQAKKLRNASNKYEDRAFYNSLIDLAEELQKRIDQKQAELDGRIWNHTGW